MGGDRGVEGGAGASTRGALRAIVPLEEVGFHGVRGIAKDDAWTRWSKAQGDPTPAPAFSLASHGRVMIQRGYRGPWYEVTDIDAALEEIDGPSSRQ